MAVILAEKKSTYGSPYAWYKVETTNVSNRTANGVSISFKITSRLDNYASSLGSSYNLTAGLYLKNRWYDFKIKDNESWSGTTQHIKNQTINVTGLGSSDTLISGIKFRVVSSASDDASGLNATACGNISVPMYHTPPLITGYTITETNQDLVDAGISNDLFVSNLSQKSINISYTLYESATFTGASAYNGTTNIYQSASLPILMDLTINPLRIDTNGVPMLVSVIDSVNVRSYYSNAGGSTLSGSTMDYYNYIDYNPVSITAGSTYAKRVGQLSGQVALNINGLFFNGVIGNVDQSSYKPTIKYKYWKYGDTEPVSYTNAISSSDIYITDNTFSVIDYEIGSTTETDANYFDPENSYRIKIYIEDNFTNIESNELQIQVGEALWSEYQDRVDFKKASVQGVEIKPDIYSTNETDTGKIWIDGKKIYRKVYTLTTTNNSGIIEPHGLTDLSEYWLNLDASFIINSSECLPAVWYYNANDWARLWMNTTNVLFRSPSSLGTRTLYAVVEYTKVNN